MPKTKPTSNETDARTQTAKAETRAPARVKAGRSSAKAAKRTPNARSQQNSSTQAESHKKPKRGRSTKSARMSGLDAAAKVLESAKEPMTCKGIVEAMVAKRLWTSNGKTPHATIYSAIIREIATKGKTARFKKTDRGHFASNH